eukprot:3923241-Amphidinium_carterae.1
MAYFPSSLECVRPDRQRWQQLVACSDATAFDDLHVPAVGEVGLIGIRLCEARAGLTGEHAEMWAQAVATRMWKPGSIVEMATSTTARTSSYQCFRHGDREPSGMGVAARSTAAGAAQSRKCYTPGVPMCCSSSNVIEGLGPVEYI